MINSIFRKGLVFGIIFLFIGAGIIPSTVGINKEKTIIATFGSRGYIQDLIDNASDGDTIFIPCGIYYENIVINKSISLIGEDKNTTIIDGGIYYFFYVIYITADWVNISGFTIKSIEFNYGGAIYIQSNYNTITDNIICQNTIGINIEDSSRNNINNNTILDNYYYGIIIIESSYCTLKNNHIINSGFNFGIHPYSIEDFIHDIDKSNTVDGKPIYYWCNIKNAEIPHDAAYVALINCSNINVNNLTLINNYPGLLLVNSTNCIIKQNNILNNFLDSPFGYGVFLLYSSNNFIEYNNILNQETGISNVESTNNTIIGNNISECDSGIWRNFYNIIRDNNLFNNYKGLDYNCNSVIEGNKIYSNNCGMGSGYGENTITDNDIFDNFEGIGYIGENNLISNNNIFNNNYGINNYYGNYNIIIKNNIISNSEYGIHLYSCKENCIYHNNFINNTQNAKDGGYDNYWDDGKHGNYWSDYEEKYPNAKKKPFKGIWDTPYEIEGWDSKDNYPLIKQWPDSRTITITRNIVTFNYLFHWFLERFPILQKILNFLTI